MYRDSRNQEWCSFLALIGSSISGHATRLMILCDLCPPWRDDYGLQDFYNTFPGELKGNHDVLDRSRLCIKIKHGTEVIRVARMQSLQESLHFLVDLLTNTPTKYCRVPYRGGLLFAFPVYSFAKLEWAFHEYRAEKQNKPEFDGPSILSTSTAIYFNESRLMIHNCPPTPCQALLYQKVHFQFTVF